MHTQNNYNKIMRMHMLEYIPAINYNNYYIYVQYVVYIAVHVLTIIMYDSAIYNIECMQV